MIYSVHHVSRIRYDALVRLARFNLRLQPAGWPGQRIEDYGISVSPTPQSLRTLPGPFHTNISRVVIDEPIAELTVTSMFRAYVDSDLLPIPFDDASIAATARWALDVPGLGPIAPASYLFASQMAPRVAEIGDWARSRLRQDAGVLQSALDLTRTIHESFVYDPDATEADTPVETAFAIRRGVCQDFAHVLIVALRSVGLPAAYVSGYLRTLPPPGSPRLIGVDAMHAWVMLWCGPGRGWVGLDPTNGCLAGPDHIFVAMGRDYADVAPIDGIFLGTASQALSVSVDVMPVED